MKQLELLFCIILLLLNTSCHDNREVITPSNNEIMDTMEEYYIDEQGDLHVSTSLLTDVLEINALPDSQILEDENQRLLILTDPSDAYQHGILGDDLEATSVTIVQVVQQPRLITKFSVPEGWVIESIGPIWRDWDGDGQKEIILTLSDSTYGAKLVVYDEDGNFLGESPAIGTGYRWRHALDIASFGEDGARLLVDVQTPHIGGIVTFYSWDKVNKSISIEASLAGYSTHDIGSRVLDMFTLAEDIESEQTILILPSQSKTEIAGLRFVSGEIKEEWRIPLGGRISGSLDLIEENGVRMIKAIVDDNREVLIELPE